MDGNLRDSNGVWEGMPTKKRMLNKHIAMETQKFNLACGLHGWGTITRKPAMMEASNTPMTTYCITLVLLCISFPPCQIFAPQFGQNLVPGAIDAWQPGHTRPVP